MGSTKICSIPTRNPVQHRANNISVMKCPNLVPNPDPERKITSSITTCRIQNRRVTSSTMVCRVQDPKTTSSTTTCPTEAHPTTNSTMACPNTDPNHDQDHRPT